MGSECHKMKSSVAYVHVLSVVLASIVAIILFVQVMRIDNTTLSSPVTTRTSLSQQVSPTAHLEQRTIPP